MATWIGAIIDGAPPAARRAAAERHRIVLEADDQPRLLVHAEARLGALGPPPFARAISEELGCTVVAFAVQTAASVEEIEQWESGRLVRKLQYCADQGGWITREGEAQPWESTYFFADDEGTEDGKPWPSNLGDEITDEDIARYDRARAASDASSIMDLLSGGSTGAIERLCRSFGVDPRRPGGVHRPPTNWKPRIVIAVIVLALVGAFILGVVTGP